jgi:hypothetical protein
VKIPNNITNAIYCNLDRGPSFGGNHDMYIANGCNANSNSSCNVGNAY